MLMLAVVGAVVASIVFAALVYLGAKIGQLVSVARALEKHLAPHQIPAPASVRTPTRVKRG